jgi:AhpD family alkylhydroperoxidase
MVWYELAFTIGLANGLNAVADSLRLAPEFAGDGGRPPLLPPVDPATAPPEVRRVLDEAREFYRMEWPPAVLCALAHDPGYLADYWVALRGIFADGALDRLTKEVMALGVSVTTRSDYGSDFHLREVRRLGGSERLVIEALEVTQLFSGFTKIADTLRLAPDMGA